MKKMLSSPLFFFTIFYVVMEIKSHSWMTCPPSFVPSTSRGGHRGTLCENNGDNAPVTEVVAGDRLKIGWTSNNHAGGYVRISLIPRKLNFLDEKIVKKYIVKYACYGYDKSFPAASKRGECDHPCGARGGCQYQSHHMDYERFDTTIGIPTNVEDGMYVLQLTMLVGNDPSPYFSCGMLKISGGDTTFKCTDSSLTPTKYNCFKSNGPTLEQSGLIGERAPFCYHLDGKIGTVDENIRDPPINVQCDPRMSCSVTVNRAACERQPGMTHLDGIDYKQIHKTQQHCYVYNTVPPLPPSCDDKILNQDEEGVDCGGENCKECPPIVDPNDRYVSDLKQEISSFWTSGAITSITATLKEDIEASKCWKFNIQFGCPVKLTGSSWGNGQEIKNNNAFLLEFERSTARTFRAKRQITVTFQIENPCANGGMSGDQCDGDSCKEWTRQKITFNRLNFFVPQNPKECNFLTATAAPSE